MCSHFPSNLTFARSATQISRPFHRNCETGDSEYVLAPQHSNAEVFAMASGGDIQISGKWCFTVDSSQNYISSVSVVA